MDVKQEVLDIPRALRETLGKGRPEYEALVRKTRWGDGPIYVVGNGPSFVAGLAAAYSIEALLGWPVVVRPTSVFKAYSLAALRPRSILLVISPSGEGEETLETVQAARSRGATILTVTHDSTGPLAQAADGVFLVRPGEESQWGVKQAILDQTVVAFISLIAARVLRRHHPQLDVLEQEFEKLPGSVEWVLTQMSDAALSLAEGLAGAGGFSIVGAGFYHPTALQAAFEVERLAGLHAEGFEVSEFSQGAKRGSRQEERVVFVSGSRCRLKKKVHQAAAQARTEGAKIFSLTDAEDRELAERSLIALLVPPLTEMSGSIVTHVLLAWMGYQLGCRRKHEPKAVERKGDVKRPGGGKR